MNKKNIFSSLVYKEYYFDLFFLCLVILSFMLSVCLEFVFFRYIYGIIIYAEAAKMVFLSACLGIFSTITIPMCIFIDIGMFSFVFQGFYFIKKIKLTKQLKQKSGS